MQSMPNNHQTTTQTELQCFKPNEAVYIQLNLHTSKWIKGTVIESSYKNIRMLIQSKNRDQRSLHLKLKNHQT